MRWPCVMTTPPPIAQAVSAVAPRAVSIGSAATVDVYLTGEGFAPTGEMRVRAEYYAADDLGDDTGKFAKEFAEEFAGRNATRGTTVTASFVSVSEVRRMKRPCVCAQLALTNRMARSRECDHHGCAAGALHAAGGARRFDRQTPSLARRRAVGAAARAPEAHGRGWRGLGLRGGGGAACSACVLRRRRACRCVPRRAAVRRSALSGRNLGVRRFFRADTEPDLFLRRR